MIIFIMIFVILSKLEALFLIYVDDDLKDNKETVGILAEKMECDEFHLDDRIDFKKKTEQGFLLSI